MPPQAVDTDRRRACAAGLSGLLALSSASGQEAPLGTVQDFAWRDAGRDRDLPLRWRAPSGTGPWPLVLHSHGLGGSRAGGEAWGRAWSRAGIAVLHLQHPGSDIDTLRGGLDNLRGAMTARQLIARVDDVRFVLDELTRRQRDGESPWRDLRLDRVGLSGHSFGARTAQAAAGERFPRGLQVEEPRLAAFIALSPSIGRLSVVESFAGIRRPFLAVTGTHDGDPFGEFDGGQRRAQVYDGLPASPDGRRGLLWIAEADHMSFGGGTGFAARGLGSGPFRRAPAAVANEAVHHARVAQVSTWWWLCWLLGDAAARQGLHRLADTSVADPLLGPGDRFTQG